jgi:hypothetical protein
VVAAAVCICDPFLWRVMLRSGGSVKDCTYLYLIMPCWDQLWALLELAHVTPSGPTLTAASLLLLCCVPASAAGCELGTCV